MVFGLSKKSKKEVIYEEMISAIVVVEEKERAFQTPGRKRVRIYVSRSCVLKIQILLQGKTHIGAKYRFWHGVTISNQNKRELRNCASESAVGKQRRDNFKKFVTTFFETLIS